MTFFKIIKTFITTAFLLFVLVIGSLVYISGQQSIYGWRMLIVQSGSMEPTIGTGSLIFIKDTGDYTAGDVITFGPITRPEMLITHRIEEVVEEDGVQQFRTKGDFNQVVDQELVVPNTVIGEYQFAIPLLGRLIGFAKTQLGVILLVVIPGTIIIYDELRNILKAVKKMGSKKRMEDGELRNEDEKEEK